MGGQHRFIGRLGRVVRSVRDGVSKNERGLVLGCRPDVSSVFFRSRLLGTEDESLGLYRAAIKPRESSVLFSISNISVEGCNSRKRREASTLSLGLSRVDLMGGGVGDAPILLLSSILSRLSNGERGCLLGDLDSARAVVAYAKLSRFMGGEFRISGIFRIIGNRIRIVSRWEGATRRSKVQD